MKVATLRKVQAQGVTWARGISLGDAAESAARLLKQVRESGDDLLYRLNRQVRRHPWKAVAVGLAAGALVGLMISRNGRA